MLIANFLSTVGILALIRRCCCFRSSEMSRPDYEDATKLIIGEFNSTIAAWAAVACSILGTIGNSLTVWVLLRKPQLRRHVTTPFLLSLAVSDLVFCTFNLPITAVRFFLREWGEEWQTCKWFPFFFYANISISAFSMAAVALNRYVGIFHPDHMEQIFSRYIFTSSSLHKNWNNFLLC